MRLLNTYLVEDSPLIREDLIATLEELVQVQVVGTADDECTAVLRLNRRDPAIDLVIIDIFLKSGSGLGVLRAVRPTIGLCKIVVLSNYATGDMRRKCLELGADRIFDKSHEIDSLVDYCRHLADEAPPPGRISATQTQGIR